ncbi:MAG: hypothetical protein ACK5NT_00115 [Pyrinomonadaceae bacterium]
MAEALMELKCTKCDAPARENAEFCFACGSKLETVEDNNVSDAWFRDDIKPETGTEPKAEPEQSAKEPTIVEDIQTKKSDSPKENFDKAENDSEAIEKPNEKTNPAQKNGIANVKSGSERLTRSAATLKSKGNSERTKRIEVSWENYRNNPNVGFMVLSAIVVMVVSLLVFLTYYIK